MKLLGEGKWQDYWGKFLRVGKRDDDGAIYKPVFTSLVPGLWLRDNEVRDVRWYEYPEYGARWMKKVLHFNLWTLVFVILTALFYAFLLFLFTVPPLVRAGVDVNGIRNIVCQPKYNWSCEHAMRVAFCESSYNTRAVSRTGDVGLFQINWIHGYSRESLKSPQFNTWVAYKLWLQRGWQPWYSSQKCHR